MDLKKLGKGVSGAVTLFGIVSSLFGSLIIAVLYLLFNVNTSILTIVIISVFGFVGALIDSILGQLFQVLYYDDNLNTFSEKKYSDNMENRRIKGYSIITNDIVNIVAPLLSVLLYFCYLLIIK